VAAGLVGSIGHRTSGTLGGFLDEYIGSRSDIKTGTRDHFKSAQRWLEKYLGADRDMASVTAGEADAYRIWLGSKGGQAENTARRLCSRAKQFFRAALRRKLITENPFGEMKKLVVGPSPERRVRFIDSATAQQVLAACPDDEWRVIFALVRFGGLRCPSEITPLKWTDINFEEGKITVTCVKTEHHDGRGMRVIPLFDELRDHLVAWRSKAPTELPWVIGRVRSNKTNLRTQLVRIIEEAGLKAWPKLFQNLRSTRETELMETFPAHVVCAWMGNTPKVAAKHYLQVTDEHFAKANGKAPQPGAA
jgi:integrase